MIYVYSVTKRMTNSMDIINAADKIATQNDRWLFVATLIVFGIFASYVMKYFVKQHESLMADHRQARDAYQTSLTGMVKDQGEQNSKLSVCIDRNTQVLAEVRDSMQECRRNRAQV